MPERPYTVLSCCMSLDGYLGTGTEERLMLSNDADFDRVDSVRASCDARTAHGCSRSGILALRYRRVLP